jgi:hypothetical protein
MDHDRRKVLALLGGGVAAVGLGTSLLRCTSDRSVESARGASSEKGEVKHEPLPYAKLDPVHVAELGYRNFYRGDCMFGVFGAVVEVLAEKVGEPFASYPTSVTRYGAGGVMGWGTLCGAANGAAMAIYLVSKDPAPAINEVMAFYEQEALPNYMPTQPKFQVVSSIADSPLCHVSISKWCTASGYKASSPERLDRCAQLVASIAKYTAEVLNAQVEGSYKAAHPHSAAVVACRGCHEWGSVLDNIRGTMSCGACHSEQVSDHP